MKADKVRELDSKELETQVRDITEQMFHLRFQMSMGQMDGVKKLRAIRKDRARMLTILRQRALAPQAASGGEAVDKQPKGR
jgi:large subunit ribosomal protein L29